MKEYLIIVDPGKKRDPAALMVMRDNFKIVDGDSRIGIPDKKQHFYEIVFIDKFVNTKYTDLVRNVCVLSEHRDLKNNHDLLVDGTGVGEAVVDIMRESYLTPIPIVFTGGGDVNEKYSEFSSVFSNAQAGKMRGAQVLKEICVPRDDLVTAGQVVSQQGRIGIVPSLKFAEDFRKQLMGFKGDPNTTRKKMRYEAENEETHDDLIVCYLMGAWWFTRSRKTDEQIIPPAKQIADWNPMEYL
jgi:hypothetical protein